MPPKSKEEMLPYDVVGTWKALEGLVKEGLVRDIGVSNFSVPKLEILLKEATILPAVHQVTNDTSRAVHEIDYLIECNVVCSN